MDKFVGVNPPDPKYMQRCIELALKGGKNTKTNPMVGCVIVWDNKVIGEGYHEMYGENHAEINALKSIPYNLRNKIPESTLYVSLEPCSHFGKTPPCSTRIIQESIKNVVIGCLDPNPITQGNGAKYLRDNDVNVILPFCENATRALLGKFEANLNRLPYVILKWAKTADNFISEKNKRTTLSNKFTQIVTHKWRTEVDGILIGKNTAGTDNPLLTSRAFPGTNPIRIVLDSNLETELDLSLLKDKLPCWVINQKKESLEGIKKYFKINDTKNLKEVLEILFENGIYSVLVEGGASILTSFINLNLWHEARIIQTEKKLYDGIPSPNISGEIIQKLKSDNDSIIFLKNKEAKDMYDKK